MNDEKLPLNIFLELIDLYDFSVIDDLKERPKEV
jgi:hypothetical protein